MFSSRSELRSIEARLVLYFTLAAALLLAVSLGLFYWLVVRHAFAEDKAVLDDKVAALCADLSNTESTAGLSAELRRQPTAMEEEAAFSIRLLDDAGQTLAETPGMQQFLPADVFPALQAPAQNYRDHGRLFSLVTARAESGGRQYTLQIAQDRSADETFRKQFGALLAPVLLAGIVAARLISRGVTRRSLRPLGEMVQAVERIDTAHLNERVQAERWPHELQPLASAFDRMLERLDDSFRRLSQFSADLAHELRTPVANILGETQVALTRPRTSEEYRAVIESTVGECERLSGIVGSLLFLARAEGAERPVDPQRFEARAALAKLAEYYQPIAEERGITLTIKGGGEILADPMLFERAVSNLIENAVRFTPDRGAIALEAGARSEGTEISVRDTGCGIAANEIPRVFDRFYRVDRARSAHGAGLGLALVKTIAELHGGSATIYSDVGQGTTVTLVFPNCATVQGNKITTL